MIRIMALIALCYLYFKSYEKENSEVIWNRKTSIQTLARLLITTAPIKYILESKKFEKNKDSSSI